MSFCPVAPFLSPFRFLSARANNRASCRVTSREKSADRRIGDWSRSFGNCQLEIGAESKGSISETNVVNDFFQWKLCCFTPFYVPLIFTGGEVRFCTNRRYTNSSYAIPIFASVPAKLTTSTPQIQTCYFDWVPSRVSLAVLSRLTRSSVSDYNVHVLNAARSDLKPQEKRVKTASAGLHAYARKNRTVGLSQCTRASLYDNAVRVWKLF